MILPASDSRQSREIFYCDNEVYLFFFTFGSRQIAFDVIFDVRLSFAINFLDE